MVCNKCGTQNEIGARICKNCGASLDTMTTPGAFDVSATSTSNVGKGLAIASLVLGIVSFFCFPLVTGLLGIIFGGVAKSKGFRGGMATAGIVCGVIGLALWVLMLAFCGGLSLIPMGF